MPVRPPSILAVDLAGVPLANCLVLAAGTAGTLDEMGDCFDLSRVGAIVTKSITPQPREGNPTWRLLPSGVGMLNAVGLANVGVDAFVRDYGPLVAGVPTTVIGSIAGFSVDDFVRVASAFDAIGAMPAVEVNVSCPNVHGGVEFGLDPASLRELVGAMRAVLTRTRLIVKLSPVAMGLVGAVELARAAIDGAGEPGGPNQRPGADALTLCNTMRAMAIDVRSRRPMLAHKAGGLSGPAVHPIVVKIVRDVYREVARDAGVPIIGLGGVSSWESAAEFILAGATAVGVGTMNFADPRAVLRIARGLEKWVRSQGVSSVRELVGAVRED